MRTRFIPMTFALFAALAAPAFAQDATVTITAPEWAAYQAGFVTPEGRVVDTGNKGISHSEGQGYGLLLAVLAQDRPSFDRILNFTQTELLVRDDGLAAWRWDPATEPHLTDTNNATDGDILIAYALAQGGLSWGDETLTEQATAMVRTIGLTMLASAGALTVILPGEYGFSVAERDDGPIVNPSYWVYEALPLFATLTPEIDWRAVAASGLELLGPMSATRAALPSDWMALGKGQPEPAEGFPPEFGYNSIRIPLYLMRANADAEYLQPFSVIGDAEGLQRIDVTTGISQERLAEPGYRLIKAALDCTLSGTPIPDDLQTMTASTYYAATLQLLLLDHLRRNQSGCLSTEVLQ